MGAQDGKRQLVYDECSLEESLMDADPSGARKQFSLVTEVGSRDVKTMVVVRWNHTAENVLYAEELIRGGRSFYVKPGKVVRGASKGRGKH